MSAFHIAISHQQPSISEIVEDFHSRGKENYSNVYTVLNDNNIELIYYLTSFSPPHENSDTSQTYLLNITYREMYVLHLNIF